MPQKKVEYSTLQVGVGPLAKELLENLGIVEIIDNALEYQPEIKTTYGILAQVLIINRMSFSPKPLYEMEKWAKKHGIDHLLDIQAEWLDDDRLGAMLEGLATHQVEIWSETIKNVVKKYAIELEWLHSDTTSIYFEGTYKNQEGKPRDEASAPLLVKGYNKDGKPKKVQFVLSLITHKRLPIWYKPWNGNQSDDHIYLADLASLRGQGWLPDNVVLLGDRKLSNKDNILVFCQTNQHFLAPHPWTKTAKEVWEQTYKKLEEKQIEWISVEYSSQNQSGKPVNERTKYQVCEISQPLFDEEREKTYDLRWIFSHSSKKAKQDVQKRQKAIIAGEQALERVKNLLGRYDYKKDATIKRRIEKALGKAHAKSYIRYTLTGTDENQDWRLLWESNQNALNQAKKRDGIVLLCTNVPAERLSDAEVMKKYKEQINVEQTFDFIKSPVQIRPMWLHSPKRLAGLTLLIMIAVLLAGLIEYQTRRHIEETGELIEGLMPEKRDNPHPTAKKLLQAFQDYTLVVVEYPDGQKKVHYPKLRPVQQQIWNIMTECSSLPPPTLF